MIAKQKSNSIQEQETPGLHRESKTDLQTENSEFFVDSHAYERQLILIRNRGFGHVPTPAKHVLLVHMNMLQGLKIYQGLKIRHVIIHKYFKCVHVNVNSSVSAHTESLVQHLDENYMCIFLKNK